MKQDTLQAMVDSLEQTAQSTTSINVWMIVAIVELVIIVMLLMLRKPKDNRLSDIKKQVLAEGEIDFANLINSSFNAEELYKELLVKCHPDRFAPDSKMMAIANELSAKITKNKHDIKQLKALKEEAGNKLNINISTE